MNKVYVYEHHEGWTDMMYLTDHELTDGERFCDYCEEWDAPAGTASTKEELAEILGRYQIYEDRGEWTETFHQLMDKFEELTSPDHKCEITPKSDLPVGLFFYVNDNFAVASCKLYEAEDYGDFLVFPKSHYDVWNGYRYLKFRNLKTRDEVDFDYYPRGRVVYRKSDDTFIIYYDKCVADKIRRITNAYEGHRYILELDEHYCCHECNPDYCIVESVRCNLITYGLTEAEAQNLGELYSDRFHIEDLTDDFVSLISSLPDAVILNPDALSAEEKRQFAEVFANKEDTTVVLTKDVWEEESFPDKVLYQVQAFPAVEEIPALERKLTEQERRWAAELRLQKLQERICKIAYSADRKMGTQSRIQVINGTCMVFEQLCEKLEYRETLKPGDRFDYREGLLKLITSYDPTDRS